MPLVPSMGRSRISWIRASVQSISTIRPTSSSSANTWDTHGLPFPAKRQAQMTLGSSLKRIMNVPRKSVSEYPEIRTSNACIRPGVTAFTVSGTTFLTYVTNFLAEVHYSITHSHPLIVMRLNHRKRRRNPQFKFRYPQAL